MKVKPEYIGTIVMRNKITFNIDKTPESNYQYYHDNGFADLFETPQLIKTEPVKKPIIKTEPKKYKGIDETE